MRWLMSRILDLLLRPWASAHAGPGARMGFPRRLRGRQRVHFGRRTRVGAHGWIEAVVRFRDQEFDPHIDIGEDVAIGRYATITCTRLVSIGDGCLFSEGVYISDTAHDVLGFSALPLAHRGLVTGGEVHIGPRCFLGFRACVLPGVTLGEACVVGAHSVVTHSFEAGSVLAGAPARLIRRVAQP